LDSRSAKGQLTPLIVLN